MGLQSITLLCSIAAFFSCPLALSHLSSLYLIHDVLGQVYVLKSGPYTGLISSHLVPSFALCSMLYSYIFIVLLDPWTLGTIWFSWLPPSEPSDFSSLETQEYILLTKFQLLKSNFDMRPHELAPASLKEGSVPGGTLGHILCPRNSGIATSFQKSHFFTI